ncbi:2-polyprenyl-6-methoxyphenol hydroxylase-like FAD-dependent oxidoreductase [Tenggerimyces flavus]|nr:2-polyprenyl-6-methoxyphenol hydroxylase-like FAD-dependent oxidoreductase [Tenggerimyces flavus]
MRSKVLVCGAGPAGLVAAITLAHAGVDVLLVERRPDTLTLPRATAISTRTMEILRSWGLEPAVRAVAMDLKERGWITFALTSNEGMELQEGFPTAAEAAEVSPTRPALAPQDDLERVLVEHLRSLPSARVEYGVELVGLAQDDDGVTVELRGAAPRSVRVDYVIGADGVASTVRSQLGIVLEGVDDLVTHAATQFRAPLWDVVGERRYGIYVIINPEADGVVVPSGQGDRWVYGQEIPSGSPTPPAEETIRRIRIASGVPDLEVRVERTGQFTFAAMVADRYRVGRGFVIGDAAHRITPRGGTGMNTAIHDGYDLGWKLAWVLSGWAAPALLDSYEAERRPIGARNAERSARPDGSRRELAESLADDLGGRLAHAWVDGVSTLDLLGPGLTVLAGSAGSRWVDAAVTLPVPVTTHVVNGAAEVALGIEPGGAVLVRPDGQVMAKFSADVPDPATALALTSFESASYVG